MVEFHNNEKLKLLRDQFNDLGIDAFIVYSCDAHQSEYVCHYDNRRSFISDFTGSAGTALITATHAYLWTDGRYFLQASQELSSEWTLMKSGEPGVLELNDMLLSSYSNGYVVGVDSSLISASQAKALQASLAIKNINLKSTRYNPIDAIWDSSKAAARPLKPSGQLHIHDVTTAGMTHDDKIKNIQSILTTLGVNSIIITMLDEIMWLFNIRGCDVDYNPVTISYAIITLEDAHFFVDANKLTDQLVAHLGQNIKVHSYEAVEDFIKDSVKAGDKYVSDPTQTNWLLHSAIGADVVEKPSPVTLLKSIKNTHELNGIRQAHIRDGVALTAFIHWLTNEISVNGNKNSLTEYDITIELEKFRGKMSSHVGPSFSTIAGYQSNGAVIHYKPEKETAKVLGNDSLFLLDSGGQYLDGTTDVTRTLHFGVPTDRMRDCYTLVLKGHITLATIVFPEGTVGSRIDAVARLALWKYGLDYNHGTEGPQGIGFRKRENESGFFSGMTVSNEPGYYENGAFGIRIENVCITKEVNTLNNFNDKKYLGFETVTLTPIDTKLINISLLTSDEISWLNGYHSQVRTTLLPLMQEHFPEAVQFLITSTEHVA